MSENYYNNQKTGNNSEFSDNKNQNANVFFDVNVFTVDFSKGLRKFWYIIVILALIFCVFTAVISYKSYVPMYQSSVSFSVTAVTHNSSGTAVFASYYDNASATQLSKTFPYIVNTSMMRNALKDSLNTDYINGTITAEAVTPDSNIFKVTVTSNSAQDAFDIVNAVIEVYPDVSVFVVGNVNLNILIKPSLPTEPYTPNNFLRTSIIMTLVGITLGLCLIGVYAFFRNTIRKKEDFQNVLNQKCFVEIPHVIFHRKSNDKKNKDRMVLLSDRHPTFKESFRLLRKRLLRNLINDEKIIGITAPVIGEGKTTIAYNIANTLAIAGKKTAVVDFDFKQNKLQKYLDCFDKKTISDVLTEKNPDFNSVSHLQENNFYVFFAGNKNIEISESILIPFFEYLRHNFDYIFVNITPVGEVSDSVAVSNFCDTILFVVKQDSTSVNKIRVMLDYFSFSSARILGFVFNCVQDGYSGYGGYYYGGKYGYGKYGYGKRKYGYGKKGYGYGHKYGYGYGHKYGYGYGHNYGYGYGYGEDENEQEDSFDKNPKKNSHHHIKHKMDMNIQDISDSDIPDNSL